MGNKIGNQGFSSLRLFLLISLVLLSISSKCPPPTQQEIIAEGPVRYFPITVVLSEPLGDVGSVLPDYIQAMCMPAEGKNCSGLIFAPGSLNLIRLDIEGANPEKLDLGKLQNSVQASLGQPLSLQDARLARQNELNGIKISSLMAQPSGPSTAGGDKLKKILASASGQHVFAIEGAQQPASNTLGANKVTMIHDTNEVPTRIAQGFCGAPGEPPKMSACVVIYQTKMVGVVSPTPVEPDVNPSPIPPNREELEKLFRSIYVDGVKTADEQQELGTFLRSAPLDASQVTQLETEIKDRLRESEISLKQGMGYVGQKNYSQAVKEFERSAEIDPQNAFALANLCGAYLSLGNQSQAQTACAQALEIDSNNWLAHYNLGSLYARLNSKEEAIDSLSEALNSVAANQTLRITKAEVIRQMKADPSLTSLRTHHRFRQLLVQN